MSGDTMIACKDDHRSVRQRRWRYVSAARRVPDTEILEPAERAGGLGERRLILESLTRDSAIGLGDLAELPRSVVRGCVPESREVFV